MRKRMLVTVVSLSLYTLGGVTRAETQSFHTEAAASAAGWTEFGSRINDFDFGHSSTNNAEGTASGEGGGTIARSQPLGYYGDVTIGSISDLSIDLHATGRIKFVDSAYDGEFFFGYFDKDEAEADNIDYLGIHVFEPRNGLWRINSSIDGVFPGDDGIDGDRLDIADDTALNFEIDWDADGGAAAGDGKLTLTLATLDGSQTFVSTIEGFDGMTVNAFGLLNNPQGGSPDQVGNFWFDDLNYSVIPEPSSTVLALCGLLWLTSITARRRNQRE